MSYCLVRVYQCCVHLNIWYLDIIQFPQISAFCVNIHSASHPSPWTPRPLPSRPRASSTGLINDLFQHLPQAMRGTTLNEQHKPHSLMSNFSIVSEVLTDLWFVLGRDHHLIIDVASLPRCCLVTRDDKLTWSLSTYQIHPAQEPGRAWNQWKPISNLLLASC